MLQLLVRRQRSPERVTVERPLEGHVEAGLHGADGLGVDEDKGYLELAIHLLAGTTHLADHRTRRQPDLVEGHAVEAAGQVDGPHRPPGEACGVGPDEGLRQSRVRAACY